MKSTHRLAAGHCVAATFALAGCSYTTQAAPGLGLGGLYVEKLCRQDYEILKTVEGKATLKRIFFFPVPLMDRRYAGTGWITPQTASAAAFYDAQTQVPEADAFLPTNQTVSTYHWPVMPKVLYSVEDAPSMS